MTASGAIRFPINRYDPELSFNTELCFHTSRADTLAATGVGKFVSRPRLRAVLRVTPHRDIGEFGDGLERGLWLDTEEEVKPDELHCVFILRLGSEIGGWCWVLLVVPTGHEGEYKRVGVGLIDVDWVTTVRKDVQII